MDVTVVIPVFNRLDMTQACLASLAAHPPACSHEVIVVDNGSSDGTADWLASQTVYPVRVVSPGQNLGFAGGCNAGAAAADGDFVCLLNNDVEVRDGTIDRHAELLELDDAVGVVGSRLLDTDGWINHAGVLIVDDRQTGNPLTPWHRFVERGAEFPPAMDPMTYQAVTAALMTTRRAVWRGVGGLDEEYWNGYEDVDFCLTVREKLGLEVVYDPWSVATHHESQSGPERTRREKENLERFVKKWLGRVEADIVMISEDKMDLGPAGVVAPKELPAPLRASEA